MNVDIIEVSFNDQRNKHMHMIKAIDRDDVTTALTPLENIVIIFTYDKKN